MKNKKRLALVAGVLMTMSLSAGAAVLSGCGEEPVDPNVQYETENLKATYFVGSGANEFNVVFDGGQFNFSVAGDTREGTFKYDGTNLTMWFNDGGEISAVLTGGKLTFAYNEVNYEMAERKEYTVTFSGASVNPQDVVVGRKATKPSDPVKAGNIFLGWYEDAAFTKKFSFDTAITKNTTVYARFVSAISTQSEFNVKFDFGYDGATPAQDATTINGHLYNLSEPTRAGEKFVGWWVSDYNSRDKLTTKWDDSYVFTANTTLFAVWESDAPAVSVNANGISWTAKGVGNSYSVDVYNEAGTSVFHQASGATSADPKFGEKPAGEYRVEVRLNNKTTTVYYKNKALAPVSLFEVEGDVLKFNKVEGAQKYLVTAVCGDSTHSHIEEEVTSNAFDFGECEMVKGGIKFTVTAVADGKLSSVSPDYFVERNLAAATVSVDEAAGKVVWSAVENATAYTLKINDGSGTTTVPNLKATEYSIKGYTGNLTFEVIPSAHGYNSPDVTPFSYNKTTLPVPQNIHVTSDSIVWDPVDNATGYVVTINGVEKPFMTGTSFGVSVNDFSAQNLISFSVRAIAEDAAKNSYFTDVINIRPELSEENLHYYAGTLSWDAVIGAGGYGIKLNDGDEILAAAGETSKKFEFTKAGLNVFSVRSYIGANPSAWVTINVNVSKVTFDGLNGEISKEEAFVTDGVPVGLPTASRYGYDFAGWYNAAEGGVKYEDDAPFVGDEDATYYARWTAQSFKITVKLDDNGIFVDSDTPTQFDVDFDGEFKLPILDSKDATRLFGGWSNGVSTQYTDDEGNSIIGWNVAADTTLTPMWIENVFKFKSVSNGKAWSVTAGTNVTAKKLARVKIPASYDGKPVTIIGGSAFKQCTDLKIVEIPDTITNVTTGGKGPNSDGAAFYLCRGLTAINVYHVEGNNEIRYMSDDGVLLRNDDKSGKRELAVFPLAKEGEYSVPDGVEIIPIGAFSGSKISSLSLPASVALIEDEAFSGCTKLESITFRSPAEGEDAPDLEFGEKVFNISSLGLLKEITLPNRVKVNNSAEIGKIFEDNSTIQKIYFESGSSLRSIDGVVCDGTKIIFCPRARQGEYTVPNGISEIDVKAFEKCTGIKKLVVPYSLKKISAEAFSGCTGLLDIKFTISTEEFEQGATLEIGRKAFYGCTALSVVDLPIHLTKLEAHAFGNISGLKTVTIECANEVTIEDGAFAIETSGGGIGASYITDVAIGAKVKEFAIAGAFGTKIERLTVDPANQSFEADEGVLFNKGKTTIVYYPISKEGNYVIPATVTRIGGSVFEGKLGLTSIEIRATVTEIGANAFKNCKALETVTFESNRIQSLIIGTGAFEGCTGITSLTLPARADAAAADVEFTIGARAFYGCQFKELVVPEGFTEIGHVAFGNTLIENASLPASVKKLAEWCKPELDENNVEISGTGTLTKGLSTNADQAGKWYYDSAKKYVANIYGISIFDGENGRATDGLKKLEILTVAGGNTVYGTSENVLYKKNETSGALETLLFSAFRNNGTNGKVTIPSTVKTVVDDAFYSSSNLTEIEFLPLAGDNPTIEFGERVFGSSTKLAKITLPTGMTQINEGMFKSNSKLEEIFIPKTVTEIKKEAFKGCSSLIKIEFEKDGTAPLEIAAASEYKSEGSSSGNNVTTDSVFYGCDKLVNVEFPERTTKIGNYAFVACAKLNTVTLPASLLELGQGAFYECKNLNTVTFKDGKFVDKGDEEQNAKENLVIGQQAFYNNSGLKTVTLPAHLYSIGSNAFYGTGLTTVTIPVNVNNIESAAFSLCSKLETVIFKDNCKLKTMSSNVFMTCKKLTSINIDKCTSLTEIGQNAFKNCVLLQSIKLPYSLQTLGNNMFESCSILDTVTFDTRKDGENKGKCDIANIQSYAFKATNIEKFTFPESTATITLGDKLFDSCPRFTTANLSTSVKNLGSAFAQSRTLTTITIPPTHTDLQSKNKLILNIAKDKDGNAIVDENGEKASTVIMLAYSAVETTTVGDQDGIYTIPEGFTEIGENAFAGQNNIKKLILPSSVTTIGKEAFKSCRLLEEVVIPTGSALNVIGQYAFKNCHSLKKINLEAATKLTTLEQYAFSQCSSLESIQMPDSLKNIGKYVFEYCISLRTAHISAFTVGTNGTTNTAQYMFYYCYDLKNVTFADGIQAIPGYMFNYSGLEEITIPASVTAIGDTSTTSGIPGAFSYCSKLRTVKFETTGELTVSTYLFKGCSSLTTVVLSEGLKDLKKNAFDGCTSLTNVVLPDSLTTIGDSAFVGTPIEKIVLPSRLTTLGASVFSGCSKLKTVKYYSGSTHTETVDGKEVTVRDEVGNDNEVTLPATVVAIGTSLFLNCTSIEKAYIPELNINTFTSSTAPCGSMFKGCTSLNEAVFLLAMQYTGTSKTTVLNTQIPATIFQGCTSLTKAVINGKANYINASLFEGCESLTTVKYYDESLSDDPETEADERFVGADNEVTMPRFVYYLGQYSFTGCSSVTKIDLRGLRPLVAADGILKVNGTKATANMTFGNNMFTGCTQLETLILNAKTNAFAKNLFIAAKVNNVQYGACTSLTTIKYYDADVSEADGIVGADGCITLPDVGANWTAFAGCTAIEAFDLRNLTVNNIPASTFLNMTGLESIILSDKCLTFNQNAFDGCTGLKTIKYYDTTEKKVVGNDNEATFASGVTTFADNAFHNTGIVVLNLSKITKADPYSGGSVFNACPQLTTVIFSDKVTTLGGSMFGGCSKLTTVKYVKGTETIGADGVVTLPEAVTAVGNSAFVNCTGITKVDLSKLNGALASGQSTFNGCSGIQTLVLGKGFTKFVGWMFQNCSQLSTVQWMDGETLKGDAGKATFNPSFKGVNNNQYNPFNGCSSITEIDLSAMEGDLEGMGIFYLCKGLTKVTLSENIVTLPQSVFEDCELLSDIDISKVTSFGYQAFKGCKALTQVTLNDELTALAGNLFKESGLTSISLPETVTVIASGAFSGSALSAIDLSAVTEIGSRAFENCASLTSVTLSADLEAIGDYVFAGAGLTQVTLNDGLTEIGEGAFENTAITTLTIPESVKTIGSYAFAGTGLTQVTLPEELESLGSFAFNGAHLSTLYIPETVTELGTDIGCELELADIDTGAIYATDEHGVIYGTLMDGTTTINYIPADMQCEEYVLTEQHVIMPNVLKGRDGVKKVVVPVSSIVGGNISVAAFEGYNGAVEVTGLPETLDQASVTTFTSALNGFVFKTLVIGEGVTTIGDNAFLNFASAEEIVLPSSLVKIGTTSFRASKIKKINIPENVTEIGAGAKTNYAFYQAVDLEEVLFEATDLIADSTAVNQYIFYNCTGLRKVTFGNKVKNLTPRMFSGCTALEEITIPASVTVLPSELFNGSTNLKTVNLPSTITSIAGSAFNGTAISGTLNLPNVTEIGASAFENCAGLTSVTFGAEAVTVGNKAFLGTGISGALDLSAVTSIGTNVFEGLSGITAVTFGAGLTAIGNKAFYGTGLFGALDLSSVETIGNSVFEGLSGITAITFGEGLTSIGNSAFKGTGIASLTLPSTLSSLGSNVFDECTSLLSADLSKCEALTTISNNQLFRNCTKLQSVILPSALTTISSSGMFENCTSLTNIVIPENVTNISVSIFGGWTEEQTITIRYYALDTIYGWNMDKVYLNNNANIVYEKVEVETPEESETPEQGEVTEQAE